MSLLDSLGRSVDSRSHGHGHHPDDDDDSTLDVDTPHTDTDPRRPSLLPSGLTTPGEGASRGSSVTTSPRAWLGLGGGGGEEGSDASIDPSLDPSLLQVPSPACLPAC